MAYGKKSGGFTGNLTKIGSSGKKLQLKTDVKSDSLTMPSKKKAGKQAHKRA